MDDCLRRIQSTGLIRKSLTPDKSCMGLLQKIRIIFESHYTFVAFMCLISSKRDHLSQQRPSWPRGCTILYTLSQQRQIVKSTCISTQVYLKPIVGPVVRVLIMIEDGRGQVHRRHEVINSARWSTSTEHQLPFYHRSIVLSTWLQVDYDVFVGVTYKRHWGWDWGEGSRQPPGWCSTKGELEVTVTIRSWIPNPWQFSP